MAERRLPLHDYHLRHAGQLVRGGGDFLFPLAYTSPADEHQNTRTNVGLQDLSSMGEVDIKGPGSERLLEKLCVNDVRDLEPGQVQYTSMCHEGGGIVDDVTVYRFADDHFMLVTSSGPRKQAVRWIVEHAAGTTTFATDITAAVALLSLQGPRSRELLRSVARDVDVDALRFFRFASATIEG